MNKAYKVIWNVSRQAWMIVGERSKSKGKSKSSASSTRTLTRKLSAALLTVAMSAVPMQVLAVDTSWTGTDGDWFTGSNWDTSTVPTSGDNVYIDTADTVEVISSGATAASLLVIGNSNAGSLTISNGGTVNNNIAYVAFNDGSTGTVIVEGAGSTWTNTIALYVGSSDNGNLTIRNGGTVSSFIGVIGNESGSTGTVTVENSGSNWANGIDLFVGNEGTGILTISNGGAVSNTEAIIGVNLDSTGTVTVEDVGSSWTSSNDLLVGNEGTGILTISNGGAVSNRAGTMGFISGSIGTVTVENTGSTWTNTGNFYVGYGGNGNLTIRNGGTVSNGISYIGRNSGSDSTVIVEDAGSSWINSDSLSVGNDGNGSLTISNGGVVNNSFGYIGRNSGSDGTVIVEDAGSSWINSDSLSVGNDGSGSLTISNGGAVSNTAGHIGNNSGSDGTVIVEDAGSSWINSASLYVARSGDGSLTIRNGGTVSNTNGYIGYYSGLTGTVTVDGTGSTWTNSNNLSMGILGNGSLTISNGGVVTVASGITAIANNSTLNIGAASGYAAVAAGTLNTSTVAFGSGSNSLVFNHTDTVYDFTADITSGGDIKLLSGSTHFSGDLSGYYSGTLTVDGGTLAIHSGDTLSLDNSVNYTQTATGVLSIGVANDTTFAKLAVAGTATLASNAKIHVDVADVNFSFTTTSMADIISANSLTSNGFTVTDNSVLFDFSAVEDGNTVDLTLATAASGGATAAVGSTGSAAASGAANVVDALSASMASNGSTGNTEMDAAINKLGALTTDKALADAVETTLPSLSAGIAHMTSNTAGAVTAAVSSRQNTIQGLSSGDTLMTDRHVWLKPFGSRTEQDTRHHVTGYDINSYGLALGIDGDVSASWNVGAALAYINSDVKSNLAAGSHDVDMDSYIAKVYATKTLDEATVLNLQAGVGTSNYDSHRRIFTGDVASADYDSWNVQLSAEVERSFQVSDKTIFTPYLQADYSYVNVDSYRESGAGALNLNVDDDSADSLIIGVGAKANHTVSDSLSIMVNAGVGYDVMTDRSSLTSSFAGGGAQFTTEGIEPDEVVYNAGIGAKYSLTNGTEISANYTIDARQDYTDQSLSANIRMMF